MKRLLLLACIAGAITASAQVPTYVPTDGLTLWSNLNASSLEFNLDGATPTLGRFGVENSGLDFDGIDDKASISLPNLPAGNDSRSVSIWFYLQGENNLVGNGQKTIFHSGIVSHNQRFCVLHWTSGLATIGEGNDACFGCTGHGGTTNVESIPTPIGTWHHMCVTHDGSVTNMYINGELSFSADKQYNTSYNGGQFQLGFSDETHWGGEPLWGVLDDVGIWSRALNPDEVGALFMASAPVMGCTDDYSCNYNATATVNDGSCIPSGCMEEGACNFNADAECEGEACDYSCCPGPGCCGEGMHWDAGAQTCVITPPSAAPNAECTLLNLQELAEGYQILLAENAELDSLLADCNGGPPSDQSGPCAGEDVLTYHGYDYNIVEIGDQCWFAENLQTERYANGDVIPTLEEDGEWAAASEGAKCLYNNNSQNLASYGYLYNWYTGIDSRGLCPAGWHVPDQSELAEIEIGLGMSEQDAFSEGWKGASIMVSSRMRSTDWGGTDEIGFAVKPAPWRGNSNTESTQFLTTTLWDSDVGYASTENCWTVVVVSSDESNYHADSGLPGSFSVRCVKD